MITELFDFVYFPKDLEKKGKKPNEYVSVQGIKSASQTISYGLLYAYSYFQCEAGVMNLEKKDKNLIQKDFAQEQTFSKDFFLPDSLEITKDGWESLPRYSWFLSLRFKLEEPFLSRGDDPFYPLENSVCRDVASGLPMIKSTTWKGNFLDAAYRLQPFRMPEYFPEIAKWKETDWQERQNCIGNSLPYPRVKAILEEHDGLQGCPLYAIEELYNIAMQSKEKEWLSLRKKGNAPEYENHPLTLLHQLRGYPVKMIRELCGTDDEIYGGKKQFHLPLDPEKTKQDEKQCPAQGSLFFFPSYFHKTGYDIIAPVERESRTVTNPILMEVIPNRETGQLCIFYLADAKTTQEKSAKDLSFCLEVVETMLQETGFSAKKNAGYGQAKTELCKCFGNEVSWGEKEEKAKIFFQMDSNYKAFFKSDKVDSPHSLELKDEKIIQKEFYDKKAEKLLDTLSKNEKKEIKKDPKKKEKWLEGKLDKEACSKELEEKIKQCKEWWEKQKEKYPIPVEKKVSVLSDITISECVKKLKSFWSNQS